MRTKGGPPALGAPYSWVRGAMLGRPWLGLMALGLEHQILVDGGATPPHPPSPVEATLHTCWLSWVW